MTQTVNGLFDRFPDAEQAVRDLEAAGVPHRDISLVGKNQGDDPAAVDTASEAAADAGKGAGAGAVVGAAGGLLAGLGLLAIPGLGPVVAAGWLASTALGALAGGAVGAAAGGVVGALTHAGVPEDEANAYAEGVRRGGTLVTAKVSEDLAPAAHAILGDERRAVNIRLRQDEYRSGGWTRFDDAAPEYTAEEIAAERARYERV